MRTDLLEAERYPHLLLTTRQAALALAISERTFWRLVKLGRIRKTHVAEGCVRYAVEDLRAYIAATQAEDERAEREVDAALAAARTDDSPL